MFNILVQNNHKKAPFYQIFYRECELPSSEPCRSTIYLQLSTYSYESAVMLRKQRVAGTEKNLVVWAKKFWSWYRNNPSFKCSTGQTKSQFMLHSILFILLELNDISNMSIYPRPNPICPRSQALYNHPITTLVKCIKCLKYYHPSHS